MILSFRARLLFLLFCCCALLVQWPIHAALFSPGPVISQISQVDDQPLNGLKAIIQDRSGFIWLAANKGLWRFDGQSLKYFGRKGVGDQVLPDEDVRDLLEDPEGYLWLITRGGGLSRFDPQTEQFSHFSHDENNGTTLDSNQLNSISLGRDNVLWIGSNVGINRFDTKTLKNTRLNISMQPPQSAERQNIHRIFEDSQARLWFSVRRKGVYLYSLEDNTLKHFEHDEQNPNSLDDNMVSEIFESSNGDIWLGTSGSINRYRASSEDFERLSIPLKENNKVNHASVTRIVEDSFGYLWVGTFYNGVSRLDPGQTQLQEINNGGNFADSLNVLHINDIMQDDSGTVWFVTPRSGLLKIKPQATRFEHLMTSGLPRAILTGLAVDALQQLWVGSNAGLMKLNGSRKATRVEGIDSVEAMVAQSDGIVIYNKQSGLKKILNDGKVVGLNSPKVNNPTLFNDSNEQLYIVHDNGLLRFTNNKGFETLLTDRPMTGAIAQRDEQLYLAITDGSVISINTEGLEQKRFENAQIFKQLHLDALNRLWAVSVEGLLWQFDSNMQSFEPFNGLDGHKVQSVISQLDGVLWLGSEAGLLRLDPQSNQLSVYTLEQGQRLTSFDPNMAISDVNGGIILAGVNGLVLFNGQQFSSNNDVKRNEGQILLSDFKLFSQLMPLQTKDPDSPLLTTIDNTQVLRLNYKQNWFSVAFASSDYRQPERLEYSYRMKGLSEQWIATDSNTRTASFTSVKPGDYTLLFRISDPQGQMKENIRQLKVIITSPWYASNLAYFLYFISAVALAYLFYFIRTRQLLHRAAMLEQGIAERTTQLRQRADTIARLLDEKDRLIANISHEFRTPLTLILGPLESQLKNAEDEHSKSLLALAQGNGQRLLSMVDQLLDMARLKDLPTAQLQLKNVQQSCQFLLASFSELAKSHQIKLVFNNRLEHEAFVNVLPDTLEKVLSNLLSNAVKYGGDSQQITLTLERKDNDVVINVSDTGPGIADSDQTKVFERFTRLKNNPDYVPGSGIGLALVKDLLEQHQGCISLHSEVDRGTTFIVTLPLASSTPVNSDDKGFNRAIVDAAVEQISVSERPGILLSNTVDENKTQILVIEDNQDMRHYIISCLEQHYQCEQAQNGELGLQQARTHLPDLVISDVMMPVMDGFEVTKALKSDHTTSHIPVILLTARGDRQSRLRGWAEKADEYLEKPFNTDELLARVSNLLSVRQLLTEKYQASLGSEEKMPVANDVKVDSEQQASQNNDFHQAFVLQVNQILQQHYADDKFDVGRFAQEMALSHRQLGRKMKSLLDMTPAEAIRNYRLVKAGEFLKSGMTPSVAAHKAGFSTHSYFSQCFKTKFNCNPSEYAKAE